MIKNLSILINYETVCLWHSNCSYHADYCNFEQKRLVMGILELMGLNLRMRWARPPFTAACTRRAHFARKISPRLQELCYKNQKTIQTGTVAPNHNNVIGSLKTLSIGRHYFLDAAPIFVTQLKSGLNVEANPDFPLWYPQKSFPLWSKAVPKFQWVR